MATGSTKVILAAFMGNSAIAATKFGASLYTGSSAMLSEAIHSLVDSGNQLLILFGYKRAARPATAQHPFGFGKEVYFWSFVVAVLLFSLGGGVAIYEGIEKIRHPHAVESAWVNFTVLGMAIMFESGSFYVAWKEFSKLRGDRPFMAAARACKEPGIFVVLFEDMAALAGLTIALVGLLLAEWLHLPWLDGAASVAIGLLLVAVAVFLARETKALLLGEAASAEVRADIARLALAHPAVQRVNELRTMHMGPRDILLGLSVDMHDTLTGADIEKAVNELEDAIRTAHPDIRRVFIETQDAADSTEDAWQEYATRHQEG